MRACDFIALTFMTLFEVIFFVLALYLLLFYYITVFLQNFYVLRWDI